MFSPTCILLVSVLPYTLVYNRVTNCVDNSGV